MRKISVLNLEATVLDDNENQELINNISQYVRDTAEEFKQIQIPGFSQPTNGYQIYMMLNEFEDTFDQLELSGEEGIEHLQKVLFLGDFLAKEHPDYHELPFLAGENIVAANYVLERIIKPDVGRLLHGVHSLVGLRDFINDTYQKGIAYLEEALTLFDKFADGKDELSAYRSDIAGSLAKCYVRAAAFELRTMPFEIDGTRPENDPGELVKDPKYEEQAKLAQKGIDLFYDTFNNGVFVSEESAGVLSVNLADALRTFKTLDKRRDGMAFYTFALKQLGELPQIAEGINYYALN